MYSNIPYIDGQFRSILSFDNVFYVNDIIKLLSKKYENRKDKKNTKMYESGK